jgi:hypothetical protein
MTIEIAYLLPEFKKKTICILAANGTCQISMNAPFREKYHTPKNHGLTTSMPP